MTLTSGACTRSRFVLMADGADAEELTQDVFVVSWRQLRTYRGARIVVRQQRYHACMRKRACSDVTDSGAGTLIS